MPISAKNPIAQKKKKIITEKLNKNSTKANVKKFPKNINASDYVTIKEKKFKNMQEKNQNKF